MASTPMGANLITNFSSPIQGMSTGGSANMGDVTNSVTNTLMNLFSPGGNNLGPTKQYNNPLEGRLVPRFEVADTGSIIRLGDVVVFNMMSDGETFYTTVICPLVQWNWAIKQFTYSTWVFPQYPVRPTPETAPPRGIESYMLSDTTTLMRYAIGQHMTVEYMNTQRGQDNQRFNLKQIALSTQETLNINVIRGLMNSQRKVLERREKQLGHGYSYDDVMKAMQNDIDTFMCIQTPEHHNFLNVLTNCKKRMEDLGGGATDIILTDRANSLVLTKEERTDYNLGGSEAVRTVSDPNRSILPNGIGLNPWYSKTYKERSGASLGPWEKVIQIGEHYVSQDLPQNRTDKMDWYDNYVSQCRALWIYNIYQNAMIPVGPTEMLKSSMIFDANGQLMDPRGSDGRPLPDNAAGDFLMMRESDLVKRTWDEDPFGGTFAFGGISSGSHMASGRTSGAAGSSGRRGGGGGGSSGSAPRSWTSIEIVGHLGQQHLGRGTAEDAAEMLIRRTSTKSNVNHMELRRHLQEGLALFESMSKESPDLDFLDMVIAETVFDAYQSENYFDSSYNPGTGAYNNVGTTPTTGANVGISFVDPNVADARTFWKRLTSATLATRSDPHGDGNRTVKALKNAAYNRECPALPTEYKVSQKRKHWSKLTGYASYEGFLAMSDALSAAEHPGPGSPSYNVNQLRIADNFVKALKDFVSSVDTMLPGCTLFHPTDSEDVKAKAIAERIFNMAGLAVSADLRGTTSFLVDKATEAGRGQAIRGGAGTMTDLFANPEGSDWFRQTMLEKGLYRPLGGPVNKAKTAVSEFLRSLDPSQKSGKSGGKSKLFATYRKAGSRVPVGDFSSKTYIAALERLTSTYGPNGAAKDGWADADLIVMSRKAIVTEAVRLATDYAGSNLVDTAPLVLSDPFRITAIGLVWDILSIATGTLSDDPSSFLSLLEDAVTLLEPGALDPFSGTARVTTLFGQLSARLQVPLSTVVDKKTIKAIILALFDAYVKDPELRSKVESRLNEATVASDEFVAYWNTTVAGNTTVAAHPRVVYLYVYRDLEDSDGGKISLSADVGVNTTTLVLLALLNVAGIDKMIGLPISSFGGDDAMFNAGFIGGKHGKSSGHRAKGFDTDPEGEPLGFLPDSDAFVGTGLVFSAEQISDLHKKKAYGKRGNTVFDLRVANPFDLSYFVPVGSLDAVVHHIHRLDGTSMSKGLFHWREIPLLSAQKKLKCISFCGNVFRRYGIPISSLNEGMRNLCVELQDRMGSTSSLKAPLLLYLLTPFSLMAMESLIDNNVLLPIYFIVARPHMTLVTEACALVTPGINALGFTAMAGNDYVSGQTVHTKEWWAHLSFWSAVVIMHPENCYILHNLMVSDYWSGLGTTFYKNARTYNPITINPSKEFDEIVPSLFSFAVPYGELPKKNKFIATPGKIPHLTSGTRSNAIKVSQALRDERHYSTSDRYNRIWKFDTAEDYGVRSYLNFTGSSGQQGIYNTMCYKGTCFYYNVNSKEVNYVTIGEGHLKANVGVGMNAVLQGRVVKTPVFNYANRPDYKVV